MNPAPVYLDYAATTPVDPQVAQAMSECLAAGGDFGNPSSAHAYGLAAAARIERARTQVAALLAVQPQEIVFTSGATESNNLAILGVARANADRGRHLVTARTEHKSVLDPCRRLEKEGFSVSWLTPTHSGRIDPAATTFTSENDLASAMRRAAAAHGEHEKRGGQNDGNWPEWYAAYMAAEQAGTKLPI